MNAEHIYASTIPQAVTLISIIGHKRTVVMEGDMGEGKSSALAAMGEKHPDHILCYFDCTTKIPGDITIPKIQHMDDGTGYVKYLTNEELGVHLGVKLILMIDEVGKAEREILNGLLRLMLERKIGEYRLHPESIVFATSNLGAENLGDTLPPHACNRLIRLRLKKQANMEWLANFAIPNGLDPVLCGWAKDNPALFQSFSDVQNPDDNPYIYHPQAPSGNQFVTPRSLHAASDILLEREHLDDDLVENALIGTIGASGAKALMAFVKLGDDLPSLQSIKDDPHNATIPSKDATVCMVVYRSLQSMNREWVDAWMIYMARLDTEAQGLFVHGARHAKYPHRNAVMSNSRFTDWCRNNGYMFSSDKK